MRAINSPCDEVSLAGVLRSPMFGLLDETLLWLSQEAGWPTGFSRDAPLPDGKLLRERRSGHAGPSERSAQRPRRGDAPGLRAMKDRLPVAQLIYEALDRTGYDAMLLAEFLGERKLANLHKLIEQARSFDRAGIFSLSDFITQLSQFVARQPDEPLAATHPESTDVVQLMSIHQSKGLEFPVVVVPDLGPAAAADRAGGGVHAASSARCSRTHDATTGYDLLTDGRERRGPGGTDAAALRGHDAGGRSS